jgi:hypothetical protein
MANKRNGETSEEAIQVGLLGRPLFIAVILGIVVAFALFVIFYGLR